MMRPSDAPSSFFSSSASPFSKAFASASETVTLPSKSLGRSSLVSVAFVQMPCKSGWPSAVRGAVQFLDLGLCPVAVRATKTKIPADTSQRCVILLFLFLHLSGAAQDIGHGVVAFMARVLVNRSRSCNERIFKRPVLRESGGIIHCGFVEYGVRPHTSEPLDYMQILR